MTLQVYRPWIPSVLEVLGFGFDKALSGKEEEKRHVLPRCHHPPQPETLRWLHGGPRQRDRRPALLPKCQRLRAGLGYGGRGWITSKSPGIPAAVELDELKELYKKKKRL